MSLNVLVAAFVLFLAINRLHHAEDAKLEAVAQVPADVKLLAEIRDILAERPRA